VKTKIGFHIIMKDGEVKMPGMAYDEAVPQLRRILEKKKFDQWIDDTKKKSNVVIEEQALSSVRIPSAEAPAGNTPGEAQSEK